MPINKKLYICVLKIMKQLLTNMTNPAAVKGGEFNHSLFKRNSEWVKASGTNSSEKSVLHDFYLKYK